MGDVLDEVAWGALLDCEEQVAGLGADFDFEVGVGLGVVGHGEVHSKVRLHLQFNTRPECFSELKHSDVRHTLRHLMITAEQSLPLEKYNDVPEP